MVLRVKIYYKAITTLTDTLTPATTYLHILHAAIKHIIPLINTSLLKVLSVYLSDSYLKNERKYIFIMRCAASIKVCAL